MRTYMNQRFCSCIASSFFYLLYKPHLITSDWLKVLLRRSLHFTLNVSEKQSRYWWPLLAVGPGWEKVGMQVLTSLHCIVSIKKNNEVLVWYRWQKWNWDRFGMSSCLGAPWNWAGRISEEVAGAFWLGVHPGKGPELRREMEEGTAEVSLAERRATGREVGDRRGRWGKKMWGTGQWP